MTPAPPTMSNSLEQAENALKLQQDRITLWEFKAATWKEKGTHERGLIAAAARSWNALCQHAVAVDPEGRAESIPMVDSKAVQQYLKSHKEFCDAEEHLMRVTIAELKGQAEMLKLAIENTRKRGESKLVLPNG